MAVVHPLRLRDALLRQLRIRLAGDPLQDDAQQKAVEIVVTEEVSGRGAGHAGAVTARRCLLDLGGYRLHPSSGQHSQGPGVTQQTYDTLRSSQAWEKTLLIIKYDEWGGFYHHVEPPFAPVTYEECQVPGNDGLLGIRVPCMTMGSRARRCHIEKSQLDPNLILNMIAWRFGFAPLCAPGATSLNFAHILDFKSTPKLDTPAFAVPDDAGHGQACSA